MDLQKTVQRNDMDRKFEMFEKWYLSRKDEWAGKGVAMYKAGPGDFGHQYWIKMHSENGFGNIVLYESNGYYWADFEGGNYDFDVLSCRSGIDFTDESGLLIHERGNGVCKAGFWEGSGEAARAGRDLWIY